MRCRVCDAVYSGHRPAPAELDRHYGGYSRTDFDSPLTRVRYHELLREFEPYRRLGRILDVGCGVGYFLEEARAEGWDAFGTEYGLRAVEINRAKGLQVVDASAGGDHFASASFDVVTAFELIEHVSDPRVEVAAIARLVRPGGLFYCTTPNFGSLSRRVLRERWSVIDYPEHLNYFTSPTLARLLRECGFEPVKLTTTGVSLARLKRGLTAGEKPSIAAPSLDESLRNHVEHSRLLRLAKDSVNAILAATGSGDSLKGWFERRA